MTDVLLSGITGHQILIECCKAIWRRAPDFRGSRAFVILRVLLRYPT